MIIFCKLVIIFCASNQVLLKFFELYFFPFEPYFHVYLVDVFLLVPVNFIFQELLMLQKLMLFQELEELLYHFVRDGLFYEFSNALFRIHPLVLVKLLESPEQVALAVSLKLPDFVLSLVVALFQVLFKLLLFDFLASFRVLDVVLVCIVSPLEERPALRLPWFKR